MVFNTGQHATRLRAGIGDCTLLKRCTYDFEFWYRDALQFFAEFFSPIESEWLGVCLWYAMTESVLQQIPSPENPEVYGYILQDLKEKLGESKIDTELILQQVLNRSALYQHVVAEYGFDCGIATMGYHWPPWQKWHTHAELLALSERALPFWVLHAPYAARFAECWTAYHAISLYPRTASQPKEFSLEELLQTANYLARNSHKPLCELLAAPTVSGSKRGVCADREAMFFSLLKSGVPFRQSGILVGKSCHQADYGPEILSTLSCIRLERPAQRALAGGLYLPPRARAARKVLQLLELYWSCINPFCFWDGLCAIMQVVDEPEKRGADMASKDKLVRIMEILRQTDADHPITAQEIRSALRLYGIDAERKGICRDINVLKDCGWDILACEDNRKGWYLASREFEDWELKLLMDAVSQITVLPQKEAEALVKKLCGLSSAAGCISLRAMTPLYSGSHTGTPAVKRTLDTAIGAIQHGHQLGFQYAERLPDMSVQPKRDGRLYLVNPYALLCQGGRYFLVCNTVPHENLSFYRLDRMLYAEERAAALTPAEQFLGPNADLAINRYVQHSLFRYGGDKIHLVLQTHDYMADELADNFGTAAKLQPQKDGTYRYEVDVNDSNGLVYWLLQHADYVKVLEPESVKDRLLEKLEAIQKQYK